MAPLAEVHQILIGTVRFVPIDVMHRTNKRVAVAPLSAHSQISSGLELHPTLFALVARPLPDAGLDQAPLPEVGVFPVHRDVDAGHEKQLLTKIQATERETPIPGIPLVASSGISHLNESRL